MASLGHIQKSQQLVIQNFMIIMSNILIVNGSHGDFMIMPHLLALKCCCSQNSHIPREAIKSHIESALHGSAMNALWNMAKDQRRVIMNQIGWFQVGEEQFSDANMNQLAFHA